MTRLVGDSAIPGDGDEPSARPDRRSIDPEPGSETNVSADTGLQGLTIDGMDWARTQPMLVVAAREGAGDLSDLWLLDVATGSADPLTSTPDVAERDPTWSPDDLEIAVTLRTTCRRRTCQEPWTLSPPDGATLRLRRRSGALELTW